MLEIEVNRDEIHFGASMTIRFMRTLRVPVDGQAHPLLLDLGSFPIFRVEDYLGRVPGWWQASPGVFIPLHPQEAMWISFSARPWKPNAVQVAAGGMNALTGRRWSSHLRNEPQDYLVCPEQSALSGFNHGDGLVMQFVAMPPTREHPDETHWGSRHCLDGLRLTVLEPKPGLFPDHLWLARELDREGFYGDSGCEIAVTAGGPMREQIRPDPYGSQTWDLKNFGQVWVYMVNVAMFREIVGREPPDCPLTRLQPAHLPVP